MAASVEKPALADMSGYLGVGSVELLGAFFVVDGRVNLLEFANKMVSLKLWTLIATLPVLVISYILGFLSIHLLEMAVKRFAKPALNARLYADVATSENQPLIQRFADIERHCRMLYGCSCSFLVLAMGCWSEIRQLDPAFELLGQVCVAVGLLVAAVCIPVSLYYQREFATWAGATILAIAAKPDDGPANDKDGAASAS